MGRTRDGFRASSLSNSSTVTDTESHHVCWLECVTEGRESGRGSGEWQGGRDGGVGVGGAREREGEGWRMRESFCARERE